MTAISINPSRTTRLLLLGCSSLALSTPLLANDVIFSSSQAQPVSDQRTVQMSGLTQIALAGGGLASIADVAEYTINSDGSIDLYRGTVTVTGDAERDVVIRMPEALEGRVVGRNSSANFSVGEQGEASGHVLTGSIRLGRRGKRESDFREGAIWRAEGTDGPRRVVANAPIAQPGGNSDSLGAEVVALSGDAGPIGAALNGIPVTLGDALAAAGASSDIIAAGRRVELAVGNPALETFPSGDLALLVSSAAQLEGAYGGIPFNAAQADVIRSYLQFLASGGAGADYLSAYSAFALDYLDLIRAGGVPSGFDTGIATAADVESYLAFISRTGALANLAERDQILADAYLAFLASGGNRDLFAASFTDLTEAYFAFIRGGGTPAEFTGASQAALADAIAFLQQSGLAQQLSAADQALVAEFLENGGIAFAAQYETALNDYFAFLATGRRPSEYSLLDQATLRAYLETLSDTGLLETVLADQAGFFSSYLAFLRAGGDIDAFADLPSNVFAGYATQLDAYFAFLANGNLPSAFTGADLAQLQAFITELQAAGALERFVGADRAQFFADYAAFVAAGGSFDAFAGLNANIFAGYTADLNAYYDYLLAGGLPSAYGPLTQETIAQYIAALEAAGATDTFLADLAQFYQDYFAFLGTGGNPDNFAGLPVPPDFPAFASALNAYAAFLAAGGLPSNYTAEDLAQLQIFLDAIVQSGQTSDLLGANADLLTAYFTFLATGGTVDGFAGLPLYLDYVTQLNDYFAFLAGGGLPGDYALLDLATIQAYIAALNAVGGTGAFAGLDANYLDLFAFIAAGGDPALFGGLPVYADYVAALNAYFAFLENGGLPSAYTVLDQATIEAYLAALAAIDGGLAGFGDLNAFFINYYDFVLAGNDPDLFDGLPGNTGGPSVTAFAGTVTGLEVLRTQFGLPGSTLENYSGSTVTFDADGNIDTFTTSNGSQGGSGVGPINPGEESGNTGSVAWARFLDPNNNQGQLDDTGIHVVVGTPAVDLPTSGLVSYALIGGTRPTTNEGTEPAGSFTGELAIDFASMMVGIDFDIYLGQFGWNMATAGGAVDPTNGGIDVRAFGNEFFRNGFALTPLTAASCTTSCTGDLLGNLYGDGASHVGVVYRVVDGNLNARGSAIFGAPGAAGTQISSVGTLPTNGGTGTNPTSDFTGTRTDQVFYTFTYGSLAEAFGGEVTMVNGAITDLSSVLSTISSNNATIVESGDLGSVAWARWTDGTVTSTGLLGQGDTIVGPNGGYHVFAGTDTVTLPGGTIAYELVGGTSATDSAGSTPGTLTGALSIAFDSSRRVGYDLTMAVGGRSWSVSTDGGAANPQNSNVQLALGSAGWTFGAAYTNTSNTVSSTGDTCALSCLVNVSGTLYGQNADQAALAMTVNDTNSTGAFTATAIGIFGQQGAQTATATSARDLTKDNPDLTPIANGRWSRWVGAGTATSVSIDTTNVRADFDVIAALGSVVPGSDETPPRSADRYWAIERAQPSLGGIISWPHSGAVHAR